jgi:hypothetical protein
MTSKLEEGSPFYELAEYWKVAYPNQDVQIGFGLGKKTAVTTLDDYIEIFGDICKIRFSKRRGFRGIIKKDGRKIRWF